MDEMLSISLWVMIIIMTISGATMWFNAQPGVSNYNLGMTGYSQNTSYGDVSDLSDTNCTMTSLVQFPEYGLCWISKVTSPVVSAVAWIWGLFTEWSVLLNAIFSGVPGGGLFSIILTPFFYIVELGAVIVILMRLASIIRGSGSL